MAMGNTFLWTLGLLLEGMLLGVLFRRQLIQRLALFGAVISFYMLRAVTLMLAAKHVSRGAYANLLSALSLVDFVLQISLVLWIFFSIEHSTAARREVARYMRWRTFALPVGTMLACAGTWLALRIAPAYSPVPLDRSAIFCGFLFAQLFAWASMHKGARLAWTVSAGFAALGLFTILSQVSRSEAAFHNQPHLFVFWAYCNAFVWVLVLVFWLVRFAYADSRIAEASVGERSFRTSQA